ncbi:MAG: hypothetical protein WC069_04465 [Candidatus Shapirobacteria bacterium]
MGFDTKLIFLKKVLSKFINETHFTYCYIGVYNGEKINFQKEEVENVRFTRRDEFDGLYKNPDDFLKQGIEFVKGIWDTK